MRNAIARKSRVRDRQRASRFPNVRDRPATCTADHVSASSAVGLLLLHSSRLFVTCVVTFSSRATPLAPLPPPQSSLFYGGGKVARPSSGDCAPPQRSILAIANLCAKRNVRARVRDLFARANFVRAENTTCGKLRSYVCQSL